MNLKNLSLRAPVAPNAHVRWFRDSVCNPCLLSGPFAGAR